MDFGQHLAKLRENKGYSIRMPSTRKCFECGRTISGNIGMCRACIQKPKEERVKKADAVEIATPSE